MKDTVDNLADGLQLAVAEYGDSFAETKAAAMLGTGIVAQMQHSSAG